MHQKQNYMKKIIILTTLLIVATTTFSQQTKTTQALTKQDYLQKSKNQKTSARVLLGGGTVLMGAAFLIGDRKQSSFSDAGTGVVIGGIGFLAALGSIPIFIASGRNKRKGMAASAFFKMEPTPVIHGYSMVHTYNPALSVTINLP
jgi:hypothetical protein